MLKFTRIAFILLLCSANALVSAADSVRITTSVELRHVQPLLRRVAHVLDTGFGRSEADGVASEVRVMPADQPMSWSFTVNYRRASHPLQIRALMDELGTVDVDFSTSAELAPVLRAEVDAYLNSHGL